MANTATKQKDSQENEQISLKCDEDCLILDFLQAKLMQRLGCNVSKSKVRRLLMVKGVFVDDLHTHAPSFYLHKGSNVSFDFDRSKFFYEKEPKDVFYAPNPADILYEDDYFLVWNKPYNFPVDKTNFGAVVRPNLHDLLVEFLRKRAGIKFPPYLGTAHRLDRTTSGAILFTKQRAVNVPTHNLFEEHKIKKTYIAVCPAKPCKDEFVVDEYVKRISSKSSPCKWGVVRSQTPGAVSSKTDFKVLGRQQIGAVECLTMECQPFTGRTHQIRVHLSSVGLPILGDTLYGGKSFPRILLHSQSLEFVHPITGQEIKIVSPCDFACN